MRSDSLTAVNTNILNSYNVTHKFCCYITERGIAQSEWQLGYRLNNREIEVRVSAQANDFSLFHSVQVTLGTTEYHTEWVPGMKLNIHLRLVQRSRIHGIHFHSPYIFMI
jgi:hypothetical protein